ncbi:MAG TPA: glutaredoxin family protein [Candidatus Limnocylindrales bacterium]|jgi:2-methylcitrate dehydratase PrpD
MQRATIEFLTRPGCGLCDRSRLDLQALLEERAKAGRLPALVREVDIATDPELERRHLERIPVLVVGDQELALATSVRAMRGFLERTLDGTLA